MDNKDVGLPTTEASTLSNEQKRTLHDHFSVIKDAVTPLLKDIYTDHPVLVERPVLEIALDGGLEEPSLFFKPIFLFPYSTSPAVATAVHRMGFEIGPLTFGNYTDTPHRLRIGDKDLSTPAKQPDFPYIMSVRAVGDNIELLLEPREKVLQREKEQQEYDKNARNAQIISLDQEAWYRGKK